MKKYKCGLYIGRFQPLHVGHTHIIAKMLEECETVIIAVGSAQETGTKRNPFAFSERKDMIESCFLQCQKELIIVPLYDREVVSNDASWGDYVFQRVEEFCGLTPDVIYEGEEIERTTWYDNIDVEVVKVPRSIIPVSATEIRKGIVDGNHMVIVEWIPYGMRFMTDFMKERITNVENRTDN